MLSLQSTDTEIVALKFKHIEKGDSRNCSGCAVALALQERFFTECRVTFSKSIIQGVEYANSPALADFIVRWDLKKAVQPIKLVIDHDARTIDVG